MPSKIDLVNRVLSELGKNPVIALTETDASAYISRKLDELYPELLLMWRWTWAIKYREDNTPNVLNYSPDYVYTYTLPADFGHFYKWAETGDQWPVYEFVNGFLLAQTRPVQYYYIVAAASYEVLQPLSARALVLYTAAKSANTLTNNQNLKKDLEIEFEKKIVQAITQNHMENPVTQMPYNDFNRIQFF